MSAGAAKLLELLFVIALVGGWGAYELWSLRRDRARGEPQRDAVPADSRGDDACADAARRATVTDREDSAAS